MNSRISACLGCINRIDVFFEGKFAMQLNVNKINQAPVLADKGDAGIGNGGLTVDTGNNSNVTITGSLDKGGSVTATYTKQTNCC